MFIPLDGDSLHINSNRGCAAMAECILCFSNRASLLCHNPREGVARLMQINVSDAGLAGVPFYILGEGV